MSTNVARHERGIGLIIVLAVVAFLAGIGIGLVVLTGTGPKMSGSVRQDSEAFNAAETGFDEARRVIEESFAQGYWTSFEGHTCSQPNNLDVAFIGALPNPGNFRRLTDEELLAALDPNGDGVPESANVLFFRRTFAKDPAGNIDPRYAYTVFLINDEAGGGLADPSDVLVVAVGEIRVGNRILASARLEIQVAVELSGT